MLKKIFLILLLLLFLKSPEGCINVITCSTYRNMLRKKQEYQPLESAEYTITKRPTTRLFKCVLISVNVIVLLIWVITLARKSSNAGNEDFLKKSYFDRENILFIETEVYENYKAPVWESKPHDSKCAVAEDSEKFDCHPEEGGNEESCGKRGCCWEPKGSGESPGVPWCFYPKNYGGYKLVNRSFTKNEMRAFLVRSFSSPYPDDVKLLRMDVQYQTDYRIHIKITDAESNRYEPPYPEIPVVLSDEIRQPEYQFVLSSIGFKIFRSDKTLLLDQDNVGGFIFADQFLQISMKFSGKIYGLGEQQTSLELDTNWTKFTLFNRDQRPKAKANLYGSHPFYMVMEPSGKCHGVFFHNSNAMDVLLQPLPAITFRSIGGIFDMYVFLGPTPASVIKQYTEIIGRPFFPPYWSLGFHLSRFGYKNTSDIRAVWKRTREAEIPFDTQWHDIDYMDRRNDFTYDGKNYADLPKFVDEIHEAGMHYVLIIDPGISGCEPNGTYSPFDEGLEMNVFVKSASGSLFVGKVWNPKCTVFPDFTALNAVPYWSKQIIKFHKLIPFDGIWIDMNEPSNFLDGSFNGCPDTKWDNPPFTPGISGGKLSRLTICMSARHAAGLHYNVHNLYGISEAVATNKALLNLGKRPFIISRSTYPGIGKYSGHWSGDIVASWESMKGTIPKMLSFSLFGVSMMGADICGFDTNTTALLCQRWSQLGAFYPFSRNHNSDDCIDQDPVALGEDVVKSAKKALTVRYTLLPYLYTLFYKAHTEGETVARPLFFEFWNDPRTHSLDESFLWGCCVLIVPVLKEYATTVKTYMPSGRWYDWYSGLGLQSNGTEIVLSAPSDTIPVFIRGGVILPVQPPNVTTTLSRLNKIELIAATNESLGASGSLFWDDGESLDTLKTGNYGEVIFTLTPDRLFSKVSHWGFNKAPQLGSIKILGFVKPIKTIYFNNKEIKFYWDSKSLVLSVEINHPMNFSFILKWK